MKCTMCGADNAEGVKFCTSCGMKFPEAEEAKPVEEAVEAAETAAEETAEAAVTEAAETVEAAAEETTETVETAAEEIPEAIPEPEAAPETHVQGVEGAADEQLGKAEEAVNQAAASLSDAASEALGGPAGDADEGTGESSADTGSTYSMSYEDVYEESKGYIGFAIASLVCGILSIICCCIPGLSSVLSIAAVALGIVTLVKGYEGRGFAIAGIVTGAIGFPIQIFAIYFEKVSDMFK